MSIDSNRCQAFYCSSTTLPPQVQRPATRQKCFIQEAKSVVDSSNGVSPPPTPSPPSTYPPPPLLLIRPLPSQPSKSSLPPQAFSSIPISSPALGNGQGKMINITITRKRLKVTSGNGDFPFSILKPLANVLRSAGGKIKKVDTITVRTPMPSIVPIRSAPKNNFQHQNPILQPQISFQQQPPSKLSKLQSQNINFQKKHQPPQLPTLPQPPSKPQPKSIYQQPQHPQPQPQVQALMLVNNPILVTAPNLESNEPAPVQVSPSKIPTPPEAPEIIELCPYCGTYFYTYKSYTCHVITVHYSTLIRNVSTCATCAIVHLDSNSYTSHCLQAHSIYPTGTELEDPITIASPVNPLYRMCNICKVTFPSTRAIAAHFSSHLGSSIAFKCRLCRKDIHTFYALAIHLATVHSIQFKFPPNPQSGQLQSQSQCLPQAPPHSPPERSPQNSRYGSAEGGSESPDESPVESSDGSLLQSESDATSTDYSNYAPSECPSDVPTPPSTPAYAIAEHPYFDSQC